MQSLRSHVPVTTSHKRARLLSFPLGFQERILTRFAARSEFIRAQLECIGDDVTSGRLQLPEEIGSLWIDCILSTPSELRATDDKTLAAYLKASEFFQDWDMVKELCELLGAHLFNTAPQADASFTTKHHIAEVLEGLSSNLVMDVMRSAPGWLQDKLPRLPQSLASLAALAHIPSLAAGCSPAPECADQGASEDCTALTLCVHTSPVAQVAGASFDEEAADGVAGASMWLDVAPFSEQDIRNGLYTLESRPGVVACRLLARVSALQGVTLCLPDCACLLLGPGALNLQGVTFQGGAVVCSGASCQATFEDTVFDRCSLLLLSAAQATLSKAAFRNMEASQSGLGVLVHGACSRVIMQAGTVAGGTQAVAVQAGGHLEATGLTITGVAVGAEAQGEGSCLSLTGCELYDFSGRETGELAEDLSESEEEVVCDVGVHVHSSSSAHLSTLSVSGSRMQVELDHRVGLHVSGAGSNVHASKCSFLQTMMGARAQEGATLTAVACTSFGNETCGFRANSSAVVELIDCASDHDDVGVECEGGVLRATRVKVTNSDRVGFSCQGEIVLTDCSAESCRDAGVLAHDEGSKVHVEGCTFKQNGESGVLAGGQAVATVKGCHSSQHNSAGYRAIGGAQMTVISSVSDGDAEACSAKDGAQLTMEVVIVDGTLQSGRLP